MYKILSLGNALVDMITRLESDHDLQKLSLPKGSMQLVDKDQSESIYEISQQFSQKLAAGGSAANTIKGLAALGAETGYIGSVGGDSLGHFFESDLQKYQITPHLLTRDIDTGKAIAFITPDSERTFATYLGAAILLQADDLQADMFEGYQLIHIEGYLVQNYELVKRAIQLAREHGLKVSFDLASYNVVESNLDFLKEIVQSDVDIIFANEEEAKAFTGMEPHDAVHAIGQMCEIGVVKIGKEGSLIHADGEVFRVPAFPTQAIDTTGAGDLYAAGFLYGMTRNASWETCGKIGSLLASKVISDFGAGISDENWSEIHQEVRAWL